MVKWLVKKYLDVKYGEPYGEPYEFVPPVPPLVRTYCADTGYNRYRRPFFRWWLSYMPRYHLWVLDCWLEDKYDLKRVRREKWSLRVEIWNITKENKNVGRN